jgi:hypothetical protein
MVGAVVARTRDDRRMSPGAVRAGVRRGRGAIGRDRTREPRARGCVPPPPREEGDGETRALIA